MQESLGFTPLCNVMADQQTPCNVLCRVSFLPLRAIFNIAASMITLEVTDGTCQSPTQLHVSRRENITIIQQLQLHTNDVVELRNVRGVFLSGKVCLYTSEADNFYALVLHDRAPGCRDIPMALEPNPTTFFLLDPLHVASITLIFRINSVMATYLEVTDHTGTNGTVWLGGQTQALPFLTNSFLRADRLEAHKGKVTIWPWSGLKPVTQEDFSVERSCHPKCADRDRKLQEHE